MIIKQLFIGVLLAILLYGVWYGVWHGTRADSLTIKEVQVLGGSTVSHETIRDIVHTELDGTYFALIPRRFVWMYPEAAITTKVSAVPRVKNVVVTREKQTVIVAFEEYRPVALWCRVLQSKECLFLDKMGYAFAPAPYLEGAAFLRFIDYEVEPTVGQSVFAGQFINDINQFVERAYDTLALNITHVERTAPNELTYYVSGGGLIKVSTDEATDKTLENLEAILTSAEFSHLEPGNFKYIDLRFGNKVFVNEELEETGNEETASSTSVGLAI